MAHIFSRWKNSLDLSRKAAFGQLAGIFNKSEIDQNTWDRIETLLLQADVGVDTTVSIVESLRSAARTHNLKKVAEIQPLFVQNLCSNLSKPPELVFQAKPTVILFVGVNGSGKTTTIAKLGRHFAEQRKQVLLVGADTFRAAAVDQLQQWAERLDLTVVTGKLNSDPGAVVFDGIKAAIARDFDFVLVDTAGRLHTRYNLMEELRKIHRVAGNALSGAPHAVWLVIDATTGQNSLAQARAFKEAVNVTGIILSKLDTSAKGGMVFAIHSCLNLPILYAGMGEKPEDIVSFDPDEFVKGIIPD